MSAEQEQQAVVNWAKAWIDEKNRADELEDENTKLRRLLGMVQPYSKLWGNTMPTTTYDKLKKFWAECEKVLGK